MLDVYFAIKNVTPERSDTSTYPTGLRVIGAVAERPHYENPLCLIGENERMNHDHGEQSNAAVVQRRAFTFYAFETTSWYRIML